MCALYMRSKALILIDFPQAKNGQMAKVQISGVIKIGRYHEKVPEPCSHGCRVNRLG